MIHRKSMKWIIQLSIMFWQSLFLVIAEESEKIQGPNFANYLANDIKLKKLALEVQKIQLESEKSAVNNGLTCKLSTGNIVFRTNGDDSTVTFTPNASVSVPQAANLSLSASSEIKIGSLTENEKENNVVTLKVSVDLLSGISEKRKVALLKAERNVLEAKRAFQNRALEVEQEYFKELRELYSAASSIVSAQKELYEDTIKFEEIKAKGYSAGSSKYRSAQMEVLSDEHDIETKIRNLDHDCVVFAKKCGSDYKPEMHPEDFLPAELPLVVPVDVLSFDRNDFSKIENAIWEQKINGMERKTQKDLTLSANGGYTFNNSNTTTSADTVNAGLDLGFKGITLGGGISIPIGEENTNPVYTISASIEPNQIRLRNIEKKQNNISEKEEELSVKSAMDDYETAVVDQQTSLADLQWSMKTTEETYLMYVDLEQDMAKLLEQGVTTRSEYLAAKSNLRLYEIKKLLNEIDLILYNDGTKLLFCRDGEIQE